MTIDTDLATLRDELAWQLDYGNRASEHLQDFEEALDRVEAELSRLREERDAARSRVRGAEEESEIERENAEAAEAEVTRLTNKLNEDSQNFEIECLKAERDRLEYRAEAAEAEVQRLREEREGYALLAEDEAVRGEYHAEGLDERGIYGGKSHEPIEERPVDRRHPDYADDPWLAEDTPEEGAP